MTQRLQFESLKAWKTRMAVHVGEKNISITGLLASVHTIFKMLIGGLGVFICPF